MSRLFVLILCVIMLQSNQSEALEYLFVSTATGIKDEDLSNPVLSDYATGLGSGQLGMTFDNQNNLYIANYPSNLVTKITPNKTKTSITSTIRNPYGLATDSLGTVYVADKSQGWISKIDSSGNDTLWVTGAHIGTIQWLAFDTSNNLYYSTSQNIIGKVTPSGTKSVILTAAATATFAGMTYRDGYLYVINTYDHTIQKVGLTGGQTTYVTSSQLTSANAPQAMVFDAAGNIYVAMTNTSSVIKIDTVGTTSTFISGLSQPYGLAINTVVPEPSTHVFAICAVLLFVMLANSRKLKQRIGHA